MSARGGTLVAAGVLLLLAGLTARMLLLAQEEAALAHAAAGRGDAEAQARHLRRAMAHYLPGNPWVSRSCKELAQLAAIQEEKGGRAAALTSWRELRSAIMVLRTGFYQPFASELAAANARIAAITGGAPPLERLNRPPDPSPAWAALALAGFALWVGGAVLMLLRGLKPDLGLIGRLFWPLLGIVVVGWILFALGLAQA